MNNPHTNEEPPEMGSMILNPMTKRMIKVGGKVWARMVRNGQISNEYTSDKVVGDISQDDDNYQTEKTIGNLEKTQPVDIQIVRGRGKYANKLVKRKMGVNKKIIRTRIKKVVKKLEDPKEIYHFNLEDEIEKMLLGHDISEKEESDEEDEESEEESDEEEDNF